MQVINDIQMSLVSALPVVVDIIAIRVATAILAPTVNANIVLLATNQFVILPMTNSICYNKQASNYVNHYPKRFKE
jgi:hypothetical protein